MKKEGYWERRKKYKKALDKIVDYELGVKWYKENQALKKNPLKGFLEYATLGHPGIKKMPKKPVEAYKEFKRLKKYHYDPLVGFV